MISLFRPLRNRLLARYRMVTEIKQYFEMNSEALEVLVAVGKKIVSIEKYMVSERNFYKEFRKRIEQ